MKNLEQAREKNKEIFEETLEQERKLNEENFENKMAEENVPAPIISNRQILPSNAWLPIGKGNLLLDLQKLQNNLIFRISVDILHNTNFFSAFTASTIVLTIYIQQFWNILAQDAKTGEYSFQLDERWFTLNVNLLHKALKINLVVSAHPFKSPPPGE
ncbi:hypothetical protein Tco_1267192 [Tanacetum coccineum]